MSNDEPRTLKDCSDVAELLSDYHDGRFASDSWQAEQIEQHLSSCTRCAEALDDYRAISCAARVLKETEVPELDIARMQSAIHGSLGRIVAVRRIAWTGAGLSGLAAAAALIVAMLLPASPPAEKEAVATDAEVPGEEDSPAAVATSEEEDKHDAEARKKIVEEMIAELKAKPKDIDDDRVRANIRKRLEAAGIQVSSSDSDPIRIFVTRDGARLSDSMRELQQVIDQIGEGRPRPGRPGTRMIKVEGSTR